MAAAGRTSGLVIQALRSLGPEHVTPQRLEKLRRSALRGPLSAKKAAPKAAAKAPARRKAG